MYNALEFHCVIPGIVVVFSAVQNVRFKLALFGIFIGCENTIFTPVTLLESRGSTNSSSGNSNLHLTHSFEIRSTRSFHFLLTLPINYVRDQY